MDQISSSETSALLVLFWKALLQRKILLRISWCGDTIEYATRTKYSSTRFNSFQVSF